jgi:hypothetical protein
VSSTQLLVSGGPEQTVQVKRSRLTVTKTQDLYLETLFGFWSKQGRGMKCTPLPATQYHPFPLSSSQWRV